jgi:hypothetical protein
MKIIVVSDMSPYSLVDRTNVLEKAPPPSLVPLNVTCAISMLFPCLS